MYKGNDVQTLVIPKLATVTIDPHNNLNPLVEIVLADDYDGDLNDLEKRNPHPAHVFFRGNDMTAINNPDLARFLEVLSEWDTDGDGVPDCAKVVSLIEAAFWSSGVGVQQFKRPSRGLYTTLLMRLMPPAPSPHIVYGFEDLKPRFRRWHYALAVPILLMFFAVVQLEFYVAPWTRYSVVSGIGWAVTKVGLVNTLVFVASFLVAKRLILRNSPQPSVGGSLSRYTYGFFNKAAVYEEQAFREGSENWSTRQRVTSCLAFGALHMTNLIYPLATILPLAIGGGLFMFVYMRAFNRTHFRRSAVLESSLVHRGYNRLALISVVVILVTLLGVTIIGTLILSGSLVVIEGGYTLTVVGRRNRQRQQEPVGTI